MCTLHMLALQTPRQSTCGASRLCQCKLELIEARAQSTSCDLNVSLTTPRCVSSTARTQWRCLPTRTPCQYSLKYSCVAVECQPEEAAPQMQAQDEAQKAKSCLSHNPGCWQSGMQNTTRTMCLDKCVAPVHKKIVCPPQGPSTTRCTMLDAQTYSCQLGPDGPPIPIRKFSVLLTACKRTCGEQREGKFNGPGVARPRECVTGEPQDDNFVDK
jgi:hypothetical protein